MRALALLTAGLVLAGCSAGGGGDEKATVEPNELPRAVLQPDDLSRVFLRFDEGRQGIADVQGRRRKSPGRFGRLGGWKAETCNLSAYTGQTILVSFRNMTDPNTQGNGLPIPPGFWLDDLTLGAQPLSDGSSLTGWMSATQARPIPVEGFTVQLLAYKELGTSPVRIATLHLNGNFDATLNQRQLAALLGEGNNADVVAAIVMYDESTESISDYAPYSLTVN